MSHLEQAFKFDVHVRRDVDEKLSAEGVVIVAKDIKQGLVYEDGGIKVTAFDVDHGGRKARTRLPARLCLTLRCALWRYSILGESDPLF